MPTLATYRLALSRALDDFETYTIASATATTVTATLLVSTDSNASPNKYNSRWIYVPTGVAAGAQRQVTTGGYTPASGTLAVTPAWAPPPAGNDQIYLTSYFPATELVGQDTSYRRIIDQALGHILVPDEIEVAVTSARTSTAAWPWLDREDRLLAVKEPAPVSGYPPRDASWRRPRLILNAQAPFLELQVPLSGTLTLEVLRPANTWVAVGGTWGESLVGLVNETDEAKVSEEDFLEVALYEAYRVLANRSPGRPNGAWLSKAEEQLKRARAVRYYDSTLEKVPAPSATTSSTEAA